MKDLADLFLEAGSIQILNPTAASEAVSSHAPQLANRKKPYYTTQKEGHVHRVMLTYAAKGYSVKEIAGMTGYTPVAVNNILRQEHSQQTLVDEIRHLNGEDEEVVLFIKQKVVAAVKTLAGVMEDDKSKGADRIAAANAILNRRYGMPNQPINRGTDVDLNVMSIAEVAAQLPPTDGTATNGQPQ